jgi:hypothetical protein
MIQAETFIPLETQVPMPAQRSFVRYPWRVMQVGESFLFPPDVTNPSMRTAIANRRHPDKKFVTRKTPSGVRCWRVK